MSDRDHSFLGRHVAGRPVESDPFQGVGNACVDVGAVSGVIAPFDRDRRDRWRLNRFRARSRPDRPILSRLVDD